MLGKLSLRQILILGVALGILLPALVVGRFLLVDRYERELDLRVRTPMSQYADMLSSAMAVPVWNVDKEVATQFVKAVMRDRQFCKSPLKMNPEASLSTAKLPSDASVKSCMKSVRFF